jgi:hypothetical protein
MSIRSLKKMKRRLIPAIAIAAAIVPTTAQAQVMLEGGGGSSASSPTVVRPDDRGARGLVVTQIAQPVSGLDQTRVIPGYNAPSFVTATRPDDRSDRGKIVTQIRQPQFVPVSDSSPTGGFNWGSAGFGVLAGFLAAMALAAAAIGLRRQRQHAGLAY